MPEKEKLPVEDENTIHENTIDAKTAQDIGLINYVYKSAEMEEKVDDFIKEVSLKELLEIFPKILKGELSGRIVVNPNK